MDVATIQVPFKGLGLIIDAEFTITGENIQTLLSMRDMVINGLYIFIIQCHIRFVDKVQPDRDAQHLRHSPVGPTGYTIFHA